MNHQAEIALTEVILAALAVTAFVWVWVWIARRRRAELPLVPYEGRRRVPWNGLDVLFVVLFFVLAIGVLGRIVVIVLGPEVVQPVPLDGGRGGADHPMLQLVGQGGGWMLLAAGLMAVVVAPITEEFLFRVLLQGWLEAAQRRRRRQLPQVPPLLPIGAGPIALTSLAFAYMHPFVRQQYPLDYVVVMLVGQAVVNVLTMAVGIAWLRVRAGATARDLGWAPGHLASDVRLGLVAFAAVGVPIYAIQAGLTKLMPTGVAADPVSLFFFALVLGLLYYRTHRIVPSVVLHMSLNLTTFAMAWLAAAGN